MDDLTTLLREAVEDVEPTDRRAELRERVAVSSRSRHLRYAITGGLLAAAVVVTGVAVAVQQSDDPETQPCRHQARGGSQPRAASGLRRSTTSARRRRDHDCSGSSGPVRDRTRAPTRRSACCSPRPTTPTTTSYWSAGQLLGATVVNGVIEVDVDPSMTSAPLDDLALQQVIYTVQAAAGDALLPVQFVHDGNPVAEVGGLPTSEPLTNAPQLDVLALASISDPSDRRVVEGSFSARGRASSFEGNVPWELRDPDGNVVREGTTQTYGWEDHLYPWATGPIDVSDLDPGDYTFVVMTDDPSGGAEGAGPTVDTRTVIIK